MPTLDQGNPESGAEGDGHGSDYAMDTKKTPYRVRVVISVSKTRWVLGQRGGRGDILEGGSDG